MAVATYAHAAGHAEGLASRIWHRIIDARMREAESKINTYLKTFDDASLSRLGYGQAEIRAIRASRPAAVSV